MALPSSNQALRPESEVRAEIANSLASSAFLHCDVDKNDILVAIEFGPGLLSEVLDKLSATPNKDLAHLPQATRIRIHQALARRAHRSFDEAAERAEFEAWYGPESGLTGRDLASEFDLDDLGEYIYHDARDAWKVWKKARGGA